MSATWTPLDRNTHALRLGGRSPRFARASADVRPVSPARGPETVRRDEPVCAVHGASNYPLWPCGEAVHVAALIEARDAQIRADECERAAATVRARVTADNADIGPNGRALERRAIVKALRHRAAELALREAEAAEEYAAAHPLLATLPTDLLCATTSRARGTAVALEAENARLREGIERLATEMQRGRLIPGTPVFGCAACGMPNESEACEDHDEGLQHAGDMLRAMLAEGGE